jgi:hypothetical protein
MSLDRAASAGRGFLEQAATLGKFLSAAAAGVLLGLFVTWFVIEHKRGFGAIEAGPWTSWSRIGAPDVDPYSRAILAYFGETALSESEGTSFVAYGDRSGTEFDPACDYIMKGEIPLARYWTLTLFSPAGAPVANRAGRQGFTSGEVLRGGDGQFEIAISRHARPGNWLPSGEVSRYVLVLRLYDSELSAPSGTIDAKKMPMFVKGHCE